MNGKAYIYGLYCPVKEAFFYVGKSTNSVNRLDQHIRGATPGAMHRQFPHLYESSHGSYSSPKTDWIAWLLEQGAKPELVILEIVEKSSEQVSKRWGGGTLWRRAELTWTQRLHEEGHPLTNSEVSLLKHDDSEDLLLDAIERGRELFGNV